MNRDLKTSLIHFAIAAAGIAALAVINSCVPAATIGRQDGFNAQWRGFHSIPATPHLYREVEIKVRVLIVGKMEPLYAGTYSPQDTIIQILGKMTPQGIVICEAVIGHEFIHALGYQIGGIANPDELAEHGY